MITREQAAEYVRLIEASHGPRDRRLDDARTIVALYDQVERLRATASTQCVTAAEAMTERDRLALELRRLRAAEAPGTDDEAFEGTGWESRPDRPARGWWVHPHPEKPGNNVIVGRARNGRVGWIVCGLPGNGWGATIYVLALDAMRAAVPGSV